VGQKKQPTTANVGQVFPPPSTEFQRSAFGRISAIARDLKISSPIVAGTFNGGTEPCKAILGMGFPLHKPYIQLL